MKKCRVKLGQVQGKTCTGARCPLYAARLSGHLLLSLRSSPPAEGRNLSTARARLPSAFHGFAPPASRSAFPPTSCGRRAFQASDLSRPRGRAFLTSAAGNPSRAGGGRSGCNRWAGCGRRAVHALSTGLCPRCRRQRPRPEPEAGGRRLRRRMPAAAYGVRRAKAVIGRGGGGRRISGPAATK